MEPGHTEPSTDCNSFVVAALSTEKSTKPSIWTIHSLCIAVRWTNTMCYRNSHRFVFVSTFISGHLSSSKPSFFLGLIPLHCHRERHSKEGQVGPARTSNLFAEVHRQSCALHVDATWLDCRAKEVKGQRNIQFINEVPN